MGMTAILGYARVSTLARTSEPNSPRSRPAAWIRNGSSATNSPGRPRPLSPGLAAMLDYARAGDIVVVIAIDRLGRSVAEVTHTIAELSERQILLRAIREGIDTGTPAGRAVAAIMATLAELELELGRERHAASRNPAAPGNFRLPSPRNSASTAKNTSMASTSAASLARHRAAVAWAASPWAPSPVNYANPETRNYPPGECDGGVGGGGVASTEL